MRLLHVGDRGQRRRPAREDPDPSESEVRAALDDNLCRCGAHNRVVRAVLTAAAEMRRDAS